ncbi:I78 family peptidase inhibitor [Frigidibacter sp. MR17.14]|uniref:I78 family peptidase inhibitor n=1 Tax=Frigidibacter sp. MR17.14 TaxID=3126509 RepID=UPI003012DEA0
MTDTPIRSRWLPALTAAALLGACQAGTPAAPATDPAADPATTADVCGASKHQSLVGKPGKGLAPGRFGVPVRIVTPGSMMTMDYRAERLNISINEAGLVEKVYCG